jgi:hypothetical protein
MTTNNRTYSTKIQYKQQRAKDRALWYAVKKWKRG